LDPIPGRGWWRIVPCRHVWMWTSPDRRLCSPRPAPFKAAVCVLCPAQPLRREVRHGAPPHLADCLRPSGRPPTSVAASSGWSSHRVQRPARSTRPDRATDFSPPSPPVHNAFRTRRGPRAVGQCFRYCANRLRHSRRHLNPPESRRHRARQFLLRPAPSAHAARPGRVLSQPTVLLRLWRLDAARLIE
jgi:hypothetical protein